MSVHERVQVLDAVGIPFTTVADLKGPETPTPRGGTGPRPRPVEGCLGPCAWRCGVSARPPPRSSSEEVAGPLSSCADRQVPPVGVYEIARNRCTDSAGRAREITTRAQDVGPLGIGSRNRSPSVRMKIMPAISGVAASGRSVPRPPPNHSILCSRSYLASPLGRNGCTKASPGILNLVDRRPVVEHAVALGQLPDHLLRRVTPPLHGAVRLPHHGASDSHRVWLRGTRSRPLMLRGRGRACGGVGGAPGRRGRLAWSAAAAW